VNVPSARSASAAPAALPEPATLPEPAALPAPARPIDPFAGSRHGRYEDDVVVVVRHDDLARPPRGVWSARTAHFALGREQGGDAGRLVLAHALDPDAVDNDVARLLDAELFAPGWASGADTFERLFTGVVLSCRDDPLTSWECFYRTTLGRLGALAADGADGVGAANLAAEGTLAAYAPVYRRAEDLVREAASTSLLDLGCCFGFFPLQLAAHGRGGLAVRAADISPGTCDLLARVSVRLGAPVPVLVCDAACVPIPDCGVDTVTLLHVLEHVDDAHGQEILAEAVRLARRRVVVAVPLESAPDAAFGHLRTISLDDLRAWGTELEATGPWRARVEEFHGGWLVLDHLPDDVPCPRRVTIGWVPAKTSGG
jgi:SAM-dependent methyltransferase